MVPHRLTAPENTACLPLKLPEPAALMTGDVVEIDVPNRRLDVKLEDTVIAQRMRLWKPSKPSLKKGFMALYAERASSASKGAILA